MAALYKRPVMTKLRSEVSLEALRIAKEKKDPMYKKYKKFRNLYLKYRERLLQKYRSKARAKVYAS